MLPPNKAFTKILKHSNHKLTQLFAHYGTIKNKHDGYNLLELFILNRTNMLQYYVLHKWYGMENPKICWLAEKIPAEFP